VIGLIFYLHRLPLHTNGYLKYIYGTKIAVSLTSATTCQGTPCPCLVAKGITASLLKRLPVTPATS
jgi:hypothetical protein